MGGQLQQAGAPVAGTHRGRACQRGLGLGAQEPSIPVGPRLLIRHAVLQAARQLLGPRVGAFGEFRVGAQSSRGPSAVGSLDLDPKRVAPFVPTVEHHEGLSGDALHTHGDPIAAGSCILRWASPPMTQGAHLCGAHWICDEANLDSMVYRAPGLGHGECLLHGLEGS